jgi:hypothetical protein
MIRVNGHTYFRAATRRGRGEKKAADGALKASDSAAKIGPRRGHFCGAGRGM